MTVGDIDVNQARDSRSTSRGRASRNTSGIRVPIPEDRPASFWTAGRKASSWSRLKKSEGGEGNSRPYGVA